MLLSTNRRRCRGNSKTAETADDANNAMKSIPCSHVPAGRAARACFQPSRRTAHKAVATYPSALEILRSIDRKQNYRFLAVIGHARHLARSAR
jgi:hypothetical protein